jgi:hypothetical protein
MISLIDTNIMRPVVANIASTNIQILKNVNIKKH